MSFLNQNDTDPLGDDEEEAKISRPPKRKLREKYSRIWNRFTIVNHKESIASCNICGQTLSFKTTVSNLKKHVLRKHSYDVDKHSLVSFQKKTLKATTRPRPTLTELGALDGLILNVVGDEGDAVEDGVQQEVEVPSVCTEEEIHDYCVVSNNHEELEEESGRKDEQTPVIRVHYESAKSTQQTKNVPKFPTIQKAGDRNEKMKKSRIMDLQLECLEIKKYNMQMEALMLEHQLNLPRSIFTETLRSCDTMTRSTQTDVGGNNTKIYYVSENRAFRERGEQHLFTFQTSLDDL